jgi:hypothetical protein
LAKAAFLLMSTLGAVEWGEESEDLLPLLQPATAMKWSELGMWSFSQIHFSSIQKSSKLLTSLLRSTLIVWEH